MDRASDFGSEGWRFESVRAHQITHYILHGSTIHLPKLLLEILDLLYVDKLLLFPEVR